MRERSRNWLMRLCWAGLLITGAMLIGLRVGRPTYYTDGEREIAGSELTAAGMLVWQTPEVAVELPGPVEGRVAELPDGRLLYGRTTDAGTTDLVVFDPKRPDVAPEPAYGLNTGDNELAPAATSDGAVYFASDRPTGIGGYDLYRSNWTPRGFTVPVALELCNTAFDETDPAPSPVDSDLVFVRIDRKQKRGDHGVLYRCQLDSGLEPAPLFPQVGSRRTIVDRDPAYAPDGGALWFVRKDVGVPLHLCRVSMLHGELDEPAAVGRDWGVGRLRGPNPTRDGLGLGLLQPRAGDAGADLWFVSAAREVYPWWLGQRWLEWILLGVLGTCLLLLLLLHFGRRWTALDLLAQCLLLSLLLHVLIFLWLMGVEITGALLRGNEEGGSLEITVLTAAPADPSTAGDGQRRANIAALVQFTPSEREIEVNAPGIATERAAASPIDAPDAGYESDRTAADVAAQTAIADQAQSSPLRAGVDPGTSPAPATLPTVSAADLAAAAAAMAALTAGSGSRVVVEAPGGAVARASSTLDPVVAGSAGRTVTPSPQPIAVTAPALTGDTRVASALRAEASATEAAPAVAAATVGLQAPAAAAAAAATDAARPPSGAAAEVVTAAPEVQLIRGGSSAELAPAASRAPTPAPAGEPPQVATVALQDRAAEVGSTGREPAADSPGPRIDSVARALAGPVRPNRPATSRSPGAAAPVEVAMMPPAARLSRVGSSSLLAPAASKTTTPPSARLARSAGAVALQDQQYHSDHRAGAATPVAAGAADGAQPRIDSVARALAGPVRPSRPATSRSPGAAAPVEVAMMPPAARLSRVGSSSLLAPAASRTTTPPSARLARRAGAVALQDHQDHQDYRAGAAMPAPAAVADGAQRIEPVAQALTSPTERIDTAAARAEREASAAALQIAPMLPDSQLVRDVRPAAGPPPVARSRPTRAPSRRPGVASSPVRDTAAVPRPNVAVSPRADAVHSPPRPTAFALSRRDNPLDRPRRAPQFGVLALAMPDVAAPGSLLERAAAAAFEIDSGPAPAVAVTAYSNRFGPRKAKALERYGGTVETERAVADGLRYLANIQNRDGSWGSGDRFDDKYGLVYVGKSALCVLAFLGAGHTEDSDTEHSVVVARAVQHLLELQDDDTGAFGPSSCYGHGITTYALAECYGITKDPALLRPLERALTWILDHQGPRRDRRNRGGWGYFSPGLQREDSYARVSVTSWMVMALESARLSGVELPDDTLPLAREYLEASFDAPNGWFRYNQRPSRLRSSWPTLPASTPAGAFCLQLLGASADDAMVRAALEFTVERRPREYRSYSDDDFVLRGQGNVYFWYYGTLCCFLAGGDAWETWNQRLSTLLPAAQSADGSFAPIDVYAADAGDNRRDRSYTTAMCVLSLEVYYRYFTPLLIGR